MVSVQFRQKALAKVQSPEEPDIPVLRVPINHPATHGGRVCQGCRCSWPRLFVLRRGAFLYRSSSRCRRWRWWLRRGSSRAAGSLRAGAGSVMCTRPGATCARRAPKWRISPWWPKLAGRACAPPGLPAPAESGRPCFTPSVSVGPRGPGLECAQYGHHVLAAVALRHGLVVEGVADIEEERPGRPSERPPRSAGCSSGRPRQPPGRRSRWSAARGLHPGDGAGHRAGVQDVPEQALVEPVPVGEVERLGQTGDQRDQEQVHPRTSSAGHPGRGHSRTSPGTWGRAGAVRPPPCRRHPSVRAASWWLVTTLGRVIDLLLDVPRPPPGRDLGGGRGDVRPSVFVRPVTMDEDRKLQRISRTARVVLHLLQERRHPPSGVQPPAEPGTRTPQQCPADKMTIDPRAEHTSGSRSWPGTQNAGEGYGSPA